MENMGDSNSKRLLQEELLQGLELAKQLQIYSHSPSSSKETHNLLIQRIISTFEKAHEMLNWREPSVSASVSVSPPLTGRPRSEDSDRDLLEREHNRKRNTVPKWTKQIRVTQGVGVEGPLADGYSWRKYGQKDILAAAYPRQYFRCTHRHVQGCLATKQVQRSDEDPAVFEITYHGKHTCMAASNVAPPSENTNPLQQQHQGFSENFNSASYDNMSPASYGYQISDIIRTDASSENSPTVGLEMTLEFMALDLSLGI